VGMRDERKAVGAREELRRKSRGCSLWRDNSRRSPAIR
jgi:hypothetical protein